MESHADESRCICAMFDEPALPAPFPGARLAKGELRGRGLRIRYIATKKRLPAAGRFDDSQPVRQSKWYRWRKNGAAVLDYLLDAEVHTYAFSVAANAIISFIPFIVLLYTIRGVLSF